MLPGASAGEGGHGVPSAVVGHGFTQTREYYNAETGTGQGLNPFWGWSTLAYAMLLELEMGTTPPTSPPASSHSSRICSKCHLRQALKQGLTTFYLTQVTTLHNLSLIPRPLLSPKRILLANR
jgi:hypothetical protein